MKFKELTTKSEAEIKHLLVELARQSPRPFGQVKAEPAQEHQGA